MAVYYNEFDPFAAAWLRALIKAGHIADGEVDERSITDVQPADIAGFTQCHFFAGIGGWSYALRLAGWTEDRPIWTGSCPCQPFSSAGSQVGLDDPRHLWPVWYQLIRECRPDVVFGEQVEAAIAHGWLDLVSDDLEREGYAVAPVGLPAASVGAPHIRQRLWFVADSCGERRQQVSGSSSSDENQNGRQQDADHFTTGHGKDAVVVGDSDESRSQGFDERGIGSGEWASRPSGVGRVADSDGGHGEYAGIQCSGVDGLRVQGRRVDGAARDTERAESPAGFWSAAEWLACRDGKTRPAQPGIFPLAHGVPNRVGTLRGAGNAIVPQVAAEVIAAYMECV